MGRCLLLEVNKGITSGLIKHESLEIDGVNRSIGKSLGLAPEL